MILVVTPPITTNSWLQSNWSGLARREDQRHKRVRHASRSRRAPPLRVAPHAIVAALIALSPEVVEDPRQPEPIPLRPLLVRLQHRFEPLDKRPQLRKRLHRPLIAECRLAAPQDLPHRVPAQAVRHCLSDQWRSNGSPRLIRLMPLSCTKWSRRTFAIVSTQIIPALAPTFCLESRSRCTIRERGQIWTPISPLRGSFLRADLHSTSLCFPKRLMGRALPTGT